MTLAFPNPSRSFDTRRNFVQFTGYDGMSEVPFSIDVETLLGHANASEGSASLERDALAAFDGNTVAIQKAARRAYAGGRGPSYRLAASHFR